MDELNENLNKLFGDEASKVREELHKGDELLSGFAAPKPDAVVISHIKLKISAQLRTRKHHRMIRRSCEMAVAAVLVVGVFLGLVLMQNKQDTSQQTYAAAVEWNITEDNEYSLIVNELENIEGRITTIRLDDDEEDYFDTIADIEMEMLNIEGAFWKG